MLTTSPPSGARRCSTRSTPCCPDTSSSSWCSPRAAAAASSSRVEHPHEHRGRNHPRRRAGRTRRPGGHPCAPGAALHAALGVHGRHGRAAPAARLRAARLQHQHHRAADVPAHARHPGRDVERAGRLRRHDLGRPAGLHRHRRVCDRLPRPPRRAPLPGDGARGAPGRGALAADIALRPAAAPGAVRDRHVGHGRGVRDPRLASDRPRRRHRHIADRAQHLQLRRAPPVHLLARARDGGAAPVGALRAPSKPARRVAPGDPRRRGGGRVARRARRGRQADPLRAGGVRLRRGGRADPGRHDLHPAHLDLQRPVDGLHDLHGPGRRARHLRGADPGRARTLDHTDRVRRQRRRIPDRARRHRHPLRARPAARVVGDDRGALRPQADPSGLPFARARVGGSDDTGERARRRPWWRPRGSNPASEERAP
jgi:hypothetical protein